MERYLQEQKMAYETYENNPYVEKNVFINAEKKADYAPTYEEIRDRLPKPIFDGHEDYINCYDYTWRTAFGNIGGPDVNPRFVSSFIKTAFFDGFFMWDSSFIMMFTKYANRLFPFQKTLDNFYAQQYKDGFICREFTENTGIGRFSHYDPSSTGPNIMIWSEWSYFENFGDIERLRKVYYPLRAYHIWFRRNRTWPNGAYFSSGWGCGMDNVPRLQPGYHIYFSHGHMVWLDTCAQQLFNCDLLIKMNEVLQLDDVSDLVEEREHLSKLLNDTLWDEETGFYYDLWKNGELNMVKHVGAFWTLIAKIVPKDRIDRFVAHLSNENEFNRVNAVPSLSADHPVYVPRGRYWKGSVWAPTTYMVLAGLTANGYHDLAYEIGDKFLRNVVSVYNETGTVWENYAPDFVSRGSSSQPNFVGWTGLAPISVFFEYVLGIQAHVRENRIVWHVNRTERHGILQYPFGSDHTIDLVCEQRASADEEPVITVKSNKPVEVLVRWNGKEKLIKA
ncbi:MAG: glycoside hydrolase [Clostridia bacterium]|nr:glycoside hydrolase [Clostridia bacterium]